MSTQSEIYYFKCLCNIAKLLGIRPLCKSQKVSKYYTISLMLIYIIFILYLYIKFTQRINIYRDLRIILIITRMMFVVVFSLTCASMSLKFQSWNLLLKHVQTLNKICYAQNITQIKLVLLQFCINVVVVSCAKVYEYCKLGYGMDPVFYIYYQLSYSLISTFTILVGLILKSRIRIINKMLKQYLDKLSAQSKCVSYNKKDFRHIKIIFKTCTQTVNTFNSIFGWSILLYILNVGICILFIFNDFLEGRFNINSFTQVLISTNAIVSILILL